MIELFVGCLFPMLLTADNLPVYRECMQVEHNINHVINHTNMVSRYFKEEDILLALNVVYCESSGRTTAVGNNRDGTQDVGLWQFNDDTWAWLKPKLGIISKRTNPEVSTAVGIIGIVVNIVGKELIMKCCGIELAVCSVSDVAFCWNCEKNWGHIDDLR